MKSSVYTIRSRLDLPDRIMQLLLDKRAVLKHCEKGLCWSQSAMSHEEQTKNMIS